MEFKKYINAILTLIFYLVLRVKSGTITNVAAANFGPMCFCPVGVTLTLDVVQNQLFGFPRSTQPYFYGYDIEFFL